MSLEEVLFGDWRPLVGVALLGVVLGVGVALLPVATVLRCDMMLVVRGDVVLLVHSGIPGHMRIM